MTLSVYVLFDRVAEECGPVWAAKNDAVAIRNARIQLKEVRADEYRLYCLGSLDTERVELKAVDKAREIVLPEYVEPTAGTAVAARVAGAWSTRKGE